MTPTDQPQMMTVHRVHYSHMASGSGRGTNHMDVRCITAQAARDEFARRTRRAVNDPRITSIEKLRLPRTPLA